MGTAGATTFLSLSPCRRGREGAGVRAPIPAATAGPRSPLRRRVAHVPAGCAVSPGSRGRGVVMAEPQPVPGQDGGGVAAASLLVGRYRLQQVLGGGGMAQVYQARDERLDRPVAVKVFRSEAGVSGADLWEQTEIRLLAGLRHPGLVAVFDAGWSQRKPSPRLAWHDDPRGVRASPLRGNQPRAATRMRAADNANPAVTSPRPAATTLTGASSAAAPPKQKTHPRPHAAPPPPNPCPPPLPIPLAGIFRNTGSAGGAQDGGVLSPTSFSGPWQLRAPRPSASAPAPAKGPDRDVDTDTARVTKGRAFAVIRLANSSPGGHGVARPPRPRRALAGGITPA